MLSPWVNLAEPHANGVNEARKFADFQPQNIGGFAIYGSQERYKGGGGDSYDC